MGRHTHTDSVGHRAFKEKGKGSKTKQNNTSNDTQPQLHIGLEIYICG